MGLVESHRDMGEQVEIERRYYLVSLPADGVRCGDALRQATLQQCQVHGARNVVATVAKTSKQDRAELPTSTVSPEESELPFM